MFWKFRKSSVTITAELHEKIARSCKPIEQVPSEVVRVRALQKTRGEKKDHRSSHVPMLAHGI